MKLLEKILKLIDGSKEVLVMVIVQLAYAASNIVYKLATSDGMNVRIIVAYRFIFATVFMIPLAIFFEIKNRPKDTWIVIIQAFLCGLFGGALAQNTFAESLVLTSPTFIAAIGNLVPAVTFILSILFGLEKAGLRTMAGKAKVVGTMVGIGGAMLLTFYKGSEINIWTTHINLLKHYQPHETHKASSSPRNRALGCLLGLASCSSFALWLIIQTKMSTRYPLPYSCSALMVFMASIQATAYALFMEKDWSVWKLGWNIRLFTAAYTGIVVAGLMNTLIIRCVRLRGPLFVSVFNPLLLIFTAIAGSLLINESLYLVSVLGAVLIVSGLYAVLWGKNVEMKKMNQLVPMITSHEVERTELQVISSSPTNDCCKNDDNVQTRIKGNNNLEKEEK